MTVNVKLTKSQIEEIFGQLSFEDLLALCKKLSSEQQAQLIGQMIKKLPPEMTERISYQLRKEEGIKNFTNLMGKIKSEVPPEDLPSEDEITNVVNEVREELYQKRKKNR